MDRDTLIFIAFCVFILLLGVRFWQQLREPLAGEKPEALLYSDSGDCVRRFTDLYAFLVNP